MSAPEFELAAEPSDRISEIAVYDGQLNIVGKAAGHLRQKLPAGLYRVRIRVGSATAEKVIPLDQNRTVLFDPLPFASPIPLRIAEKTRTYHMSAAADAASRIPAKPLGQGASIMVFARDWSPSESSRENPAQGLSLLDAQENFLADISAEAEKRADRDVSAGWRADVAPGSYLIRSELGDFDNTVFLRPIYVSPGHQLQVFCLAADHIVGDGDQRRTMRRPDLTNAAVALSTSGSFDPDDKRVRSSQLACSALTQSRDVLLPAMIDEVTDDNFDNPMLGLFTAHLLLTSKRDDKALFRQVTDRLRSLLGDDHPDLQALWWQRGDDQSLGDGRLHALPMLRASWALAVNRSIKTFDVLSLGTFASKLTRIIPSVPWLMLMDNTWAVSDAAIDDYMKARARSQITRAEAKAALEAQKQYFRRAYAVVRNALPSGIATHLPDFSIKTLSQDASGSDASLEMPASATKDAAQSLQDDEKAELARTLAIPADVLNSILKRKGHEN